MKVGFVGLGIMGTPMAANLMKGGHELFLYSIPSVPGTLVDIGGHTWTFSQTIADIDPADWGGELRIRE